MTKEERRRALMEILAKGNGKIVGKFARDMKVPPTSENVAKVLAFTGSDGVPDIIEIAEEVEALYDGTPVPMKTDAPPSSSVQHQIKHIVHKLAGEVAGEAAGILLNKKHGSNAEMVLLDTMGLMVAITPFMTKILGETEAALCNLIGKGSTGTLGDLLSQSQGMKDLQKEIENAFKEGES